MKLTEAQLRMLATLSHAMSGVPIGLSDLSNPEFNALLEADYADASWVDYR